MANDVLPSPSSLLRSGYRKYSLYVLDTRAVAHVGDGLKTVQRIALYLLASRAEKIKTGALVGEIMESDLYNHGDTSPADAIALLASPYMNNIPLIEPVSDGGFGSRVDPTSEAISAARYTLIKRSKFAQDVLLVDSDIVPMTSNYDGSKKMPLSFLPLVPLVLLNGVTGIGVAFAPLILPRKFDDIVKAVSNVLDGKPAGKLIPYYEGRNLVVKPAPKDSGYEWHVEGSFRREGSNRIIVTDFPPKSGQHDFKNLDAYKEYLIKLEEAGNIIDFTDHSSDAINIEIKLSRNWLMDATDEDIIQLLKLRWSMSERLIVNSWDYDKLMDYESAGKIVEDFVQWRFGYYEVRYKKLLAEQTSTERYWLSVLACFKHGVPDKARAAKNRAALAELIEAAITKAKIELDSDVVDRICNIPLYRWTVEGEGDAKEKAEAARKLISEYTAILKSPQKRKDIFRSEVAVLKAKNYQ